MSRSVYKRESGKRSAILASIFIFAMAALCIRLGVWQLDRLQQRRERNVQVHSRMLAAPVELTNIPSDSIGWLNRRVIVRGTFDEARSIILPGRAYQGAPGAHVLTPAVLANGQAVLVDRGWVPAADGATVDLAKLPPVNQVADTALVQPFPRAIGRGKTGMTTQSRGATDSAFKRVWFAIDEAALRAQFPYALGAIQVRVLPATTSPELPVREPPPEMSEGPHLGYAIQWFSFATIAIVGWLIMVLRSRVRR